MQVSTFIGLDVHKATISVAVAHEERGGDIRYWRTDPHRPDHIRKLAEKLMKTDLWNLRPHKRKIEAKERPLQTVYDTGENSQRGVNGEARQK